VSGLATIERDFNGTPVRFIEREDASLWMDAEQLAECLGYANADGVRRLANRHDDEVSAFRSRVKVTRDRGEGEVTAEVVIFEERALYLLACFAKTDKAKAFRAWVIETCRDLRTNGKVLVDREEWEKRQSFTATLLSAYEKQAEAMAEVASAAGFLLGLRRRTKPKWDPRQSLIPGVSFEEIATDEPAGGES
jgi:prophage antirepressor-like protein